MKKTLLLFSLLMTLKSFSQTTTTLTCNVHSLNISNSGSVDTTQIGITRFNVINGTVISDTLVFQGNYTNIDVQLSVSSYTSVLASTPSHLTIDNWTTSLYSGGAGSTYTTSSVNNTVTITFTITPQILNKFYCIELSNLVITGTTNSTTGIKESLDLTKTVIYPNPTNDLINIKSDNEIGLISILNYLGEVIYNSECNYKDFQISLLNQSKGVYFIKTKNQSFKLIKN